VKGVIKMAKKMILAIVVLVAALAIPTAASAATSVQRPFPSGLSTSSASKAWSQVQSRAEVDGSYAAAIARSGGSSSYTSSNYEVVGYGKVNGGTNSAVTTSNGKTIGVPDTAVCKTGAKALVLRDKATSKLVKICTGCGNIRIKKVPVRPVKWKKGTTLKINRLIKVPFSGACPDGRSVSGYVPLRIKGTIRAKAWGKVSGKLSVRVKAAYTIAVKAGKVVLDCGTPPPPPPHDACVNIEGNQATAPYGMVINAIGNCVTQTITCGTGWHWSDVYVNCIQVVCGVVIVGDNNNVDIGDICSPDGPPPPTCPDNRPVPPSGDCDRPPLITVIKPAHMFPGGTTYAYAKAYDPDGDEMVVNITATGPAIASVDSTVEAPSYYDGLTDSWTTCPVNWKCFRARLRASGVQGAVATVTATVNAGGKMATSSIQTFPILPEQGF
jgi:hypothetical protein